MAFTAYIDNQLINHLLGSGTYTKPSNLYLALYIGDPLTTGSEISTSGSAYVRQSSTFSVSGGIATNSAVIEYPVATTNWGTIDYCAVYDALTSGNMLVTAPLTIAKNIVAGDILRFPVSSISVTLT